MWWSVIAGLLKSRARGRVDGAKNKRQFLPSFTPRCLQSKGGGRLADCSSVIGRIGLWGRTWPCEGGKGGGGGMRAVGRRGRRDDVREKGRGKLGKGERGH